jgi:hypothetical protein
MYPERVGHGIRNRNHEYTAEDRRHGARAGIETGYQADSRNDTGRCAKVEAGARAVSLEKLHAILSVVFQ